MSRDENKKNTNSGNKPTSGEKKNYHSDWVDKVQNIGDSLIEKRAAEVKPRPTKTGGKKKSENAD